MELEEKNDVPDCESIAGKIIKLLFEHGVTYRKAEEVMEYVFCKLWEQRVQNCD